MKYVRIVEGKFISRPNRFIAHVDIAGEEVVVHVKNTGRCKELLIAGVTVYLQESDNPNRKTKYDLIAVKKGSLLINMDSQIPNAVAEEWVRRGNVFPEGAHIKREQKWGNSRFDLYASWKKHRSKPQEAFMEVKGVTLEVDGIARFPDAPTERGIKHIQELCHAVKEGYEAYILFVIQMKGITSFEPNWETHSAFGENLRIAGDNGVKILAYDCKVEVDSIVLDKKIPVNL